MIIISDERIKQILKEDYKYLKTIYPQEKILGVFTYDKASYGFAQTESELKVKMYYLPDLEELCTSINLKDEFIEHGNHTIHIRDIRLILDNILKQETTSMECFFAKNYIITPKYKKVFVDSIIEKREDIFHCNPKLRVEASVQEALDCIKRFLETKDTEYLFNACRLRLSTDLYIQGNSIEDCLYLKKDYMVNYLLTIKNGIVMPDLDEVTNDLEEMKKLSHTLETHPEQEDLVKQCIIEIMQIALTKTVSADEFLSTLTEAEQSALKYIMQYIENGEGAVSISHLTNTSGMSRPVFKSVLQKMKDMQIAEINNMGVKGTHIKIIDGVFLNIDDYID